MTGCFAESNRRRRTGGSAISDRGSVNSKAGLPVSRAAPWKERNPLFWGHYSEKFKLVKCYIWSVAFMWC
jgi:hypothetical protein